MFVSAIEKKKLHTMKLGYNELGYLQTLSYNEQI